MGDFQCCTYQIAYLYKKEIVMRAYYFQEIPIFMCAYQGAG